MKKVFFFVAAAVALLSSCAKEIVEPEITPSGKEQVTIYADINKTKSTVDAEGIYSWQSGETISVVEQDAIAGTPFTLTDAETGAFNGTKTAGKDLVFAVTPATALTSALEDSGDVLYDITLPNSYDNYVPGTTNAVMVGEPNGGSYKFLFSHVMPLLKFKYVNVPIGTKKLYFSNYNNFVTGAWSDINATSGLTLSEDDQNFAADGSSVTLTLAESVYEANQTMEFYVPVPAATYQDFSIELRDKDGDTIENTSKSKSGLSIPLTAGDIFPTPVVSLAEATKGATWNPTLSAAANLSKTGATLDGLTVTSSENSSSFESSGSARGCAFANGSDPVITIPYTGFIQNIIVTMSTNAGDNKVTASVAVDGHSLGTQQSILSGTDNANKNYEFKVDGKAYRKGTVVITINNANDSKSSWIKSIAINGDIREDANLSYDVTTINKATGAANFTNPITNPNNLTGITYASNKTDVATVDAATGEVTIVGAGEATITATFAGNETYKAGNASYTITVAAATLTLSADTTPAKADCTDNATVTFTVTSNVDWTAAKGTDTNNIIKSVSSEGSTVTVTFNANSAETEKTAEVTVTPVLPALSALAKSITVTQKKYELVDVLNRALTGVTGTTYTDWSNKNGSVSSAKYAGNSAGGNSSIQLRSSDNSGIVSTTSGGAITKVVVSWNSSTQSGRTLNVYGKNSAYTAASNLYSTSSQGTLIGTIVYGTSTELEIDGYYEYIGLCSNSGAMYLNEIDIFWGIAKSDNELAWSKTSDTGTITSGEPTPPTATLSNPHSLAVTYSSSDESVATINASNGDIQLVAEGTTTISATTAGDATYKPGTVSYELTVNDSREACATPTFSKAEGEVAADTEVTISSTTTGSTIYYTTNGDTPTVGGATTSAGTEGAASVTVTIDFAKTIKAIAVKSPTNKPSAVAKADYTVSDGSDPLRYTLTPATGSNSDYTKNCDITISDITWNVSGNSQMTPWRIGGKSLDKVDRTLYSKTALAYNVSKIEITHGGASSITVNSMTVIVSQHSDFSEPVSTLTPSFTANGVVTVERPNGKDWSNCYFKVVYNVSVSVTSNKFIEFTEAKFYGATVTP